MPAAASACAPPAETCNYADDDCDGVIDDGVRSLGPRTFHSDYYAFVRPRSARVGTQIYTMWRMNSWVYFWILDSDGEIAPRTHRIQLQTGNHFDLESNGSVPVYAYVDRTTGDVHVHRISASPTAAAPYQWSRTIDTNVQEVELAVGSADVWVYTRSSTGHVQYHTLDLATGALERTTYVGASPKPIAVASNGFIEHLAALYSSTAGAIRWMIRRNDTIDRSGTFAVDDTRLREIAIAGDYTSSGPITRNGVVVVYSMASGGGQPGELYYYSWRADGQTFTQRIITGSAPTSAIAQLDLEMADGTALLGAVWSSYSSSTTGIPRVIELERSTSARYAVRVKTLPVPDAAHEGVSVVRFPARLGAIPDRIFYDPAENGIASIPIGCF